MNLGRIIGLSIFTIHQNWHRNRRREQEGIIYSKFRPLHFQFRDVLCVWRELCKDNSFNTGQNNRLPFLDILGYLKNTHKSPKFSKVRQVPTREFPTKFPGWDSYSLFQIWIFRGYSLNTLKYPKMAICYFFLCKTYNAFLVWIRSMYFSKSK